MAKKSATPPPRSASICERVCARSVFLPRAKKSPDGRASPRAAWRRGDPERFPDFGKTCVVGPCGHRIRSRREKRRRGQNPNYAITSRTYPGGHVAGSAGHSDHPGGRTDSLSGPDARRRPRSAHAGRRTQRPPRRHPGDRESVCGEQVLPVVPCPLRGGVRTRIPCRRPRPFPPDGRNNSRRREPCYLPDRLMPWKGPRRRRGGLVFSSCGRAFPSGKKAPPFSVSLCRYSGGF